MRFLITRSMNGLDFLSLFIDDRLYQIEQLFQVHYCHGNANIMSTILLLLNVKHYVQSNSELYGVG